MNFWQQLASEFDIGPKHEAVKDARGHLQNPVPSDWQWLEEALKDEQNKWFVAAVFKSYPVPKRLVKPFLQAAINETNPSFNHWMLSKEAMTKLLQVEWLPFTGQT